MLSKKYLSSARFDCSTPRESLNALYQTDILDVTDDAEASSSSKNLDISEKSEFCTPVDSLNTSKQTDFLDSIVEEGNNVTCTEEVEKMFTPGKYDIRGILKQISINMYNLQEDVRNALHHYNPHLFNLQENRLEETLLALI